MGSTNNSKDVEVVFSTLRVEHFNPIVLEIGLEENPDLVEELRAKAHMRTLHYRKAAAQLYNRKVRPRPISDGDLILRKVEVSDPEHSRNKLAPRWERPYRII
ncbi:hypothetical protein B296_00030479 [Ensete ventricosum]|uniref:Uncharacterized protein n=1 Tax=Ensete ventricosum TaxID=4639 RepID=A0A426YIQ5_ENSVE|nr:hypothetical protein B296_00030479 [Ensete ventricosum]